MSQVRTEQVRSLPQEGVPPTGSAGGRSGTWSEFCDVVQELGTVAGDARSLSDEVFGEELAEALDIVELVRVDVVTVELLEVRQILGGLLGVVDFLFLPCVVRRELQVVSVRCTRCRPQDRLVRLVATRRAVLPTTSPPRSRLGAFPP